MANIRAISAAIRAEPIPLLSHVEINPLLSKGSKLYDFSLEGSRDRRGPDFYQEVMGSNPIALTIKIKDLRKFDGSLFPRKLDWDAHGKQWRGFSGATLVLSVRDLPTACSTRAFQTPQPIAVVSGGPIYRLLDWQAYVSAHIHEVT